MGAFGSWRRSPVRVLVLAGLGAFLLAAAPSASATVSPQVRVGTSAFAKLDQGGDLRIRVAGVCTPNAVLLEAFVYLSQDGSSTESTGIPMSCDGAVHRDTVLVPIADVPFHEGMATASAYALVMDPGSGQTADFNWFRVITILPP
jgi:hypothetical protein